MGIQCKSKLYRNLPIWLHRSNPSQLHPVPRFGLAWYLFEDINYRDISPNLCSFHAHCVQQKVYMDAVSLRATVDYYLHNALHVCIHTCIHVLCIHVYIMYACIDIPCKHTPVHSLCACMHLCIHVCIHLFMNANIIIYIHIFIHMCTL